MPKRNRMSGGVILGKYACQTIGSLTNNLYIFLKIECCKIYIQEFNTKIMTTLVPSDLLHACMHVYRIIMQMHGYSVLALSFQFILKLGTFFTVIYTHILK
jgi:hypothetical protein